jgi:hypothetical protein
VKQIIVRGKIETWAIPKPKAGFGFISINVNQMILIKSDPNCFGNCQSQSAICEKNKIILRA